MNLSVNITKKIRNEKRQTLSCIPCATKPYRMGRTLPSRSLNGSAAIAVFIPFLQMVVNVDSWITQSVVNVLGMFPFWQCPAVVVHRAFRPPIGETMKITSTSITPPPHHPQNPATTTPY